MNLRICLLLRKNLLVHVQFLFLMAMILKKWNFLQNIDKFQVTWENMKANAVSKIQSIIWARYFNSRQAFFDRKHLSTIFFHQMIALN